MPRLLIDKHPVITYSTGPYEKYWPALSNYILNKYGEGPFLEHEVVKTILQDCFDFLVGEFRKIILLQKEVSFFFYTFWLHEESIKLLVKFREGLPFTAISENEFSTYRRILKLIIEQGCDLDFPKGRYPNARELIVMDMVLQNLLYIGTWMYNFADQIAYQRMIEEAHKIKFDRNKMLEYPWQHHYGAVYDIVMPAHAKDYEHGVFDENGIADLKQAIEKCFGISYDFAGGQIFKIKKHFDEKDPCQTISPEVLPINLAKSAGISPELAELFYQGLTITRYNKLSIETAIYKPHSIQRYMFRPILIYNIAGEDRALVGYEKYPETIYTLATNAVQWDTLSPEWLSVKCMRQFMEQKGNEHDKILEDKIEVIAQQTGLLYDRNIESFKQNGHQNINIIKLCGEIDFILINTETKKIFVSDVKYNKARYEGVGFSMDNTNFINKYEKQLLKKVNWVTDNLSVVQTHFKLKYNASTLDISSYEIQGIFLLNTPTFYMFNGKYKGITLYRIADYLSGKFDYPKIVIETEDFVGSFYHPYFRKPIIIDF